MGSVSRNVSRNTADHMARYNVNKLLAELPTPITKNRFPAPPASRPEKQFAGLHTLRFFQAVRYAPSGPPSVWGMPPRHQSAAEAVLAKVCQAGSVWCGVVDTINALSPGRGVRRSR